MKELYKLILSIARDIFFPLENALVSPGSFTALLFKYSVDIDENVAGKIMELLSIEELVESIEDFLHQLENTDKDEAELDLLLEGLFLAQTLFEKIEILRELDPKEVAEELTDEDWLAAIDKLVNDLFSNYIVGKTPLLGILLQIFGVIELYLSDFQEEEFLLRKFSFSRISKILKSKEIFEEYYGWGNSEKGINVEQLMLVLNNTFAQFGKPSYLINQEIEKQIESKILSKYIPKTHAQYEKAQYLSVPLRGYIDESNNEHYLGLRVIPIPSEGSAVLDDILVEIEKRGNPKGVKNDDFNVNIDLFDNDKILKLHFVPQQPVGTNFKEIISPKIEVASFYEEPLYLIGEDSNSTLKVSYTDLVTSFAINDISKSPNPEITLFIDNIDFQYTQSNSDSFAKSLFKGFETSLTFSLKAYWSHKYGLHLEGNSALEFILNIHKGSGLFRIERLRLGIEPSSEINLKVSSDFTAKIAIFKFYVEDVGLKLLLEQKTVNNLGLINATPKLKIPRGYAVSIDSEFIQGGGYLENDPANHRYAGILQLNLQAIDLTAIALITTKLPNNEDGFSMLVSISVLFKPAIQLSFGFTLNGVGGLLGVNRTTKVDVLRERLESGAVESIMFPKDVIENADRIISDLRAVFPAKKKHYVIAPFLRLGWGAPTIIEVDLGVLIELPFKGRILLLGSVGIYLPAKEVPKPLTEIHIDVLGDFNFAEEYIRVDGRLRDSHIVDIPLKGGFAFVLSWDRQPQFLLSVGGYHPRYKKPERFPDVPRLAAVIKKKKKNLNVELTCEFYTAITSNSFQIGFRADLYVKYKKAKVYGYFGFNALLQFKPFYFEADISLGVLVKYKGKKLAGIDFYCLLTGPKPWTFKGHAKVKVAFIKFKIKFKASWGKKQEVLPQVVKPAELLEKLAEQLRLVGNWSARLPANFESVELLKTIEEEDEAKELVLHPSGYLEVRQTVVPLDKSIERFGNSKVNGNPKFSITLEDNANDVAPLKEYFARGQYEQLSDADKISSKDFELFNAGYRFQNTNNDFDFGAEDDLAHTNSLYEEIIIDEQLISKKEEEAVKADWDGFNLHQSSRFKRYDHKTGTGFSLVEMPVFEEDMIYYVLREDGELGTEKTFDTESDALQFIKANYADKTDKYQIMEEEEYLVFMEGV